MIKKKKGDDPVLLALADLSGAVGAGFQSVREEFAEVGDRFNKVDRELRDVRAQLDRVETLVLQDHERRLHALEKKVGITGR